MIVLDSSCWIEFFSDGPQAEKIKPFLADLRQVLTPTIVLYEVYTFIKRERSEEEALRHVALLQRARVEVFAEGNALWAADVSLERGLSMADAIVFSAAQAHDVPLVTMDADFKGLPGVEYLGR